MIKKMFSWATVAVIMVLLGLMASVLNQSVGTLSSGSPLTSRLSATPQVSQVKISNVRDSLFTVSWITDQETNGTVQYGTDPSNLNLTANDERGADTSDDTHYVTIVDLAASTTYYFDVVSGGTTDNNSGNHYTVTTGPTLGLPSSDVIYGPVFKTDGTTKAEGTIVYITLQDNDGSDSTGSAATLSSIVDSDGLWNASLGDARSSDLSAYFSYSASGDQLLIEAQGGADGSTTQTIDTANDRPAAGMTLAPTPTPTPTATATNTPTNTPTATNTAVPPTNTPTVPPTNTPTATNTAVPPTNTPTATNTAVPPTNTPTATNTAVPPTNTPTATNTAVPPTNTPTATNTAVPATNTPTATNTAVPPTNTPTATTVPSAGADLQVISVTVPVEIYAGYTIPITWTVRNEGALATSVESWSDRIYYSDDGTLDTSADTTLATVAHSGALAAGASYGASTTIDLPENISGRPYLFVVSDHDDQVEEETHEGNNSTAKEIYIKMTATSTSSGNDVGLSWPHMTHDSSGNPVDVTYYEVWRSNEAYFTPGDVGSTRVVTVTAPTGAGRTVESSRIANTVGFTDTGVMGHSNSYYYAIQAMGDSGAIETSNRAGKSTYPLTYGRYNAIALSLGGTGMADAESLAASINAQGSASVSQILKWDASLGTRGAFRTYEPGNPFSDNFSTATGDPYFVFLSGSGSGTLALVGTISTAGAISFDLIGDANGCRYNFISLPLDRGDLSDAQSLEGAISDVSQLLAWDATLGTRGAFRTYEPGNPFSDNFSSEVGQAYFVCMQASKRWP